jgi:hypothetical protein
MVYDQARDQVVLFGGNVNGVIGDTWIWDGTTWTQSTPEHSPAARQNMGMAYDAARGLVVLFGGESSDRYHGDTWTWDGADWTMRNPRHSPTRLTGVGMTYDAARRRVVLFGGSRNDAFGVGPSRDTWTWNGADWTKREPAHSPSPRFGPGMADDIAHNEVVLFGGNGKYSPLGDTWTWDGADWTRRTSVDRPSARLAPGMAYDVANGDVMLFGGDDRGSALGDTWSWDGADWIRRTPPNAPSSRDVTSMTYDGGKVVLFGGAGEEPDPYWLGDTWTWDGATWAIPFRASLRLAQTSGPPGTVVQVQGWGFGAAETVTLRFIDGADGANALAEVTTDGTGAFTAQVTIPRGTTPGERRVSAKGHDSGQHRNRPFVVIANR